MSVQQEINFERLGLKSNTSIHFWGVKLLLLLNSKSFRLPEMFGKLVHSRKLRNEKFRSWLLSFLGGDR